MEVTRTKVQQPEQTQASKRAENIQREAVRQAAATELKPPKAQEAEKKAGRERARPNHRYPPQRECLSGHRQARWPSVQPTAQRRRSSRP